MDNDPGPVVWRYLLCLVPLMLIWTNTHGGFLAGLGVLTLFLLVRLGTRWPGRRAGGAVLSVLAVVWATTLLNPYGPELPGWLLQALSRPRPEIPEWHSPDWFASGSIKLWWLATLLFVSWTLTQRRRDAAQLVATALVAWQAASHQRHIPFLAIAFLFWAPPHLTSALRRLLPDGQADGPFGKPNWVPGPMLRQGVVICCTIVTIALIPSIIGRLRNLEIPLDEFPVAATQFLQSRGVSGKIVVSAPWAQFVLSECGARHGDDDGLRVAFDGRFRTCYPQSIVDMYFDFDRGAGGASERFRAPHSPAVDPDRILTFRNPDLLLIDRRNRHIQQILARHRADWSLLYQDEIAQIWGRRNLYDRPGAPAYLSPDERTIGEAPQTGRLAWSARIRVSTGRLASRHTVPNSTIGAISGPPPTQTTGVDNRRSVDGTERNHSPSAKLHNEGI